MISNHMYVWLNEQKALARANASIAQRQVDEFVQHGAGQTLIDDAILRRKLANLQMKLIDDFSRELLNSPSSSVTTTEGE